MNQPRDKEQDPRLRVRVISDPEQVPVFNCLVYVGRDEQGRFHARSATLEGVAAEGDSERAALQGVVTAFKATVGRFLEDDQSIPWLDRPKQPNDGEQQRFIAVHL